MITFLQFEQKNANIFAKLFGENIFKITISVPGLPLTLWTRATRR
jgi:hypothetical protein